MIIKTSCLRMKSYCTKTTLSSNNDKSLQALDRIRTYPSGTNTFKACKSEILSKHK